MNNWDIIFYSILGIIFLILLIVLVICSFNTFYCIVFERDEVGIYRKYLKLNDDEFIIKHTFKFKKTDKLFIVFTTEKYKDEIITLECNNKTSFVSSINENYECLASSFYKRDTKKLYEKLYRIWINNDKDIQHYDFYKLNK